MLKWLAVVLVLLMAALVVVPPIHFVIRISSEIPSEAEFKQQITGATTLEALQQDALDWMATGPHDDRNAAFAARLGSNGTAVIADEYVWVEFGGGFYHYGLRIGPPGFVPPTERGWRLSRWADGVWYYEETGD